jgi:hypothetical protein
MSSVNSFVYAAAEMVTVNFSRPFFHRQQPQFRVLNQPTHVPTPSQPQHARTPSEASSAAQSEITMPSGNCSPAGSSKQVEDLAKGLETVSFSTGTNETTHSLPESNPYEQLPPAGSPRDQAVDENAAARATGKAPIMKAAPPKKKKMARYYSHALSEEDKHALAVGEMNHNLREWKLEDVQRFHDSRLDLIHPGPEGQKAMIEKLMDDREKSEKVLANVKKRGHVSHSLFRRQTGGNAVGASNVNLRQAYESPRIVRHSSAPVTPAAGSPISPQASLSRGFGASTPTLVFTPPCGDSEGASQEENAQAAQVPDRTDDYFVQPIARRSQSPHSRSSSSNRVSTYISSPLNPQAAPYRPPNHRPRPDVTFDSFLAPHMSGKGEAFRGAENAAGYNSADGATTLEAKKSRKRLVKRVTRIASLPDIRKRNTERGDENQDMK